MSQAFLEISLFNSCPIGCAYCPQDILGGKLNQKKDMLYYTDYLKAIKKLPEDSIVCFSGFSDPSFHPYLAQMADTAVKLGHKIMLLSTMFGSTATEYYQLSRLTWEHFSVHLPDSLGKTPIPEFVDIDKYTEMLDLIKALPPNGFFLYNYHAGEVHKLVKGHLAEGVQVLPLNIHDRAGNVQDNTIKGSCIGGNIQCSHSAQFKYPQGSALMLPNGECYLCCNDFGLQHRLGNLLKQSWEDIIYSDEMVKVSEGMKYEDIDIICRHCSSAVRA